MGRTHQECRRVKFARFEGAAAKWLRTALIWVTTQRVVAISPPPEERSSWRKFLAHHISKFFVTQVKVDWAPYYWILRLEGGCRSLKKFSRQKTYNIYFGGKIYPTPIPLPFSWLHRRSFLRTSAVGYQVSLLPAHLGTRWTLNCWASVSNCYTLDCWAVVLSTRPRRSYWENNFGTSWLSMRPRNINRKFSKSKFLPAVGLELVNLGFLGRRLIH